MNEKKWLEMAVAEAFRLIDENVHEYDEGAATLAEMKSGVHKIVSDTLSRVYDHAFTEGINAADLDNDSTEEEFDVEFDDEDEGDELR